MATREKLVEIVVNAAKKKAGKPQIECAMALGLAKKHRAKAAEIGAICDEQKIKITRCQLGCFGGKKP